MYESRGRILRPIRRGTSRVPPSTTPSEGESKKPKEVPMSLARVGQKAPDFEASAYVAGGFKKVKLSDFAGKWVVLCFYPGDFTFV